MISEYKRIKQVLDEKYYLIRDRETNNLIKILQIFRIITELSDFYAVKQNGIKLGDIEVTKPH